ncbi:hypothetical protein BOX15_Mlig000833g2 [Macrostomum lignano]|uniref:Uncharacterized protein n=1 Tax=Macrostomum lignano TaxID=282301 RepID=A0A267GX35_9PLAT|nr:hypothetical protein BOX15_Mlig000833g2 [Macrostomum lignano]
MADEYEEYNYEVDRLGGKGGKGRSKKDQAEHKDSESAGRHDRIAVQKLENNRENQKEANLHPGPKNSKATGGAGKKSGDKDSDTAEKVDIDSI